MHLKIASPTEKKRMESSEETHRTPHVVCTKENIENYMVSAAQITWSNYVVGGENHTPFLPQQVLYCNSSSSGCQGRFEIKPELKI